MTDITRRKLLGSAAAVAVLPLMPRTEQVPVMMQCDVASGPDRTGLALMEMHEDQIRRIREATHLAYPLMESAGDGRRTAAEIQARMTHYELVAFPFQKGRAE